MTLRMGSLFTGTGALDEGVSAVLGCDHAWMAEHYPPARRALRDNYPHATLYGDAAAIDWATVPEVDVLVAGFPCTDMSLLGKRAGLAPTRPGQLFAPPSGWELTVRAARATRPGLIVLENVSALLTAPPSDVTAGPTGPGGGADGDPGSALGVVLRDLAELGFDAEWTCAEAGAAGAAHRRRRWFLTAAHPDRFRRGAWRDRHEAGEPARFGWDEPSGGALGADWTPEPVWGKHAGAIARWARVIGRRAPLPVLMGARNPALWVWLMGLPERWLTRSGLGPAEIIRMCGNGVVAQQVAMTLPVLLDRLAEPWPAEVPDELGELDELPAAA